MAAKQCLDNGDWFSRVEGNPFREWTDYSPCDKTDDTINLEHVRLALYAISTVALVPAIVIFHIYRSLQVTRISIHKNLFSLFFSSRPPQSFTGFRFSSRTSPHLAAQPTPQSPRYRRTVSGAGCSWLSPNTFVSQTTPGCGQRGITFTDC